MSTISRIAFESYSADVQVLNTAAFITRALSRAPSDTSRMVSEHIGGMEEALSRAIVCQDVFSDLISVTLANELREDGVGVVGVDPGDMRTQMHQAAFPGEDISDRPLPESTLPFWAWLFGQDPTTVSGQRFQAQGELWEVAA